MRKLAILLLAFAGVSPARNRRKAHKVVRPTQHSHTTNIPYQAAARAPQGPSVERYKEIQQALADKGYYKGEVTGQWTPASTEALRAFQSDQNLRVDGKVGSLSLIALGLGPKRTLTAQNTPTPPPVEAAPVSVPE